MKILFIVPRLDKASSRYRAIQYEPYLREWAIESKYIALPKNIIKRFKFWYTCKHYDGIVLQKRLLSWWDLFWLKKFSNKLFFDFDDAIIFTDSGVIKKTRQRKFHRIMANADLVIAGNTYLQQLAIECRQKIMRSSKSHSHNNQYSVKVLATPIDLSRYEQKNYQTKDKITIGWIGSRVTLPYLEAIKPVLEKLGGEYSNLVLKIVADEFIECESLTVEKIRWTAENEIADLQGMDIGIMPLDDNAWTRGKCSFKLLQYMAVGVPVVCNPVGMNKDVVRDGINGFWAANKEQWVQQLSILIEDEALRERMGNLGRKRIEEEYNVEVSAKKMAGWFKKI